jgi:ribonuclease HI
LHYIYIRLSSNPDSTRKPGYILGVTLDDKLSWRPHIENKIKKAKLTLMAIRSTIGKSWGPSPMCARWSWTGVIRPALTYGAIVWSRTASQAWAKKKLQGLQMMALSQIANVRPSTPSAGLEVMYGVPPLDLFIQNCAQNAAIRVKPDTTWQPQAKVKARVAHGRPLQHQFPAGLWQADTDEITHQKVWEKNYTVHLPTKEIDMLPSGDIDAYTDGSLMGGKSGAGAYILKKSEGNRTHLCSLRGNTKQATVFQSEVIAVKATAEALISNNPSGQQIVFHEDNQATLKTLDSTDITKKTCKDTRDSLNVLGKENTVVLEWVKAHLGILGNEKADKLAKAGGNSTAGLGTGATANSAIKKELKENMTNEWNHRWQSTIDYRQTKV